MGFIEEVAVCPPSKVGQVALGWHNYPSNTKSSDYAVAKFAGENRNAMELMEVAQKAWAMH